MKFMNINLYKLFIKQTIRIGYTKPLNHFTKKIYKDMFQEKM